MEEIFTVDARGLTCPQPVLETKKVLDENNLDVIKVVVDNPSSKENVSRFARNQGWDVTVEDAGSDRFDITIRRTDASIHPSSPEELPTCTTSVPQAQTRNVVYIGARHMGKGDDELGGKLMRGFLRTLIDCEPLPWRIVFINSGVSLTTVDDEAVDAVSMLRHKGVEILSCGTCLEHFGLVDELKVGKVTNMFEIIDSLNKASKVISPD